ncbi:hypothetical protein GQX74_013503 [Glossina fuscipes]|nr:hypothetical protein GQX74_013503 [Glossina fuscipes]
MKGAFAQPCDRSSGSSRVACLSELLVLVVTGVSHPSADEGDAELVVAIDWSQGLHWIAKDPHWELLPAFISIWLVSLRVMELSPLIATENIQELNIFVKFPTQLNFNFHTFTRTVFGMRACILRELKTIYVPKHQEQFYLYLIIAVAAGMLLCVTLVIGRLTLQRRRACCKNSLSSVSNNEKIVRDKVQSTSDKDGKHQQVPARDTQPNVSFGDNLSDIDADVDLRTQMPLSGLSSRNESYMTYAPNHSCNLGSLRDNHTSTHYGTATTMLMPSTSQHNNLIMAGDHNVNNVKVLSCPATVGNRQNTPPTPSSLYTSIGLCSLSLGGPIGTEEHPSPAQTVATQHL